jgi:hypothetical protein
MVTGFREESQVIGIKCDLKLVKAGRAFAGKISSALHPKIKSGPAIQLVQLRCG